MRSSKVNRLLSFTIQEITVVMIISGIAISIAFIGLNLILKSYEMTMKRQTFITTLSKWDYELTKELTRADFVISTDSGFVLKTETSLISSYSNGGNYIAKYNGYDYDTLLLDNSDIKLYLSINHSEIKSGRQLVDLICLNGSYDKEIWNLCYRKNYSSSTLIKSEITNFDIEWL